MDKPRHPHVVRTWTVERTRIAVHGPMPKKAEPPRSARTRAPKIRVEPEKHG